MTSNRVHAMETALTHRDLAYLIPSSNGITVNNGELRMSESVSNRKFIDVSPPEGNSKH